MKDNPAMILDQKKIDQAGAALRQIVQNVAEFQKTFAQMNPAEQGLMGCIVISIVNHSEPMSMAGYVGNDQMAVGLVNQLAANIHEITNSRRQQQQQKQQAPMITPAEAKPN